MVDPTEVPSGYFNQTFTVEYTIHGSLDGATFVPEEIRAPQSNGDPQQLYQIEVEGNAGLFDIDYVVETLADRRGVSGARVLYQIWLVSPVAGDGSAAIQVVDAVDGTPIVQEVVDSLIGLTEYYRTRPVLVPQGSVLRILGFGDPGIEPIKLRLTIEYVKDSIALVHALCSCNGMQGPRGPEGPEGPQGPQGEEGPTGPQGDVGTNTDLDDTLILSNISGNNVAGARANLGIPFGNTGTLSAGPMTSANLLSSTPRTRYTSAIGAGSPAALRGALGLWWRGNAAGLGGFNVSWRFGLASFVSGFRSFVGLRAIAALIPNVDPSTLVNIVGLGLNAGSTQWSLMHNDGAGAATVIPLGAGFNVTVDDFLELRLESDVNGASIDWTVTNLTTGAVQAGNLAADIPAAAVFLASHFWVNTGTDATTAAIMDITDVLGITPMP